MQIITRYIVNKLQFVLKKMSLILNYMLEREIAALKAKKVALLLTRCF